MGLDMYLNSSRKLDEADKNAIDYLDSLNIPDEDFHEGYGFYLTSWDEDENAIRTKLTELLPNEGGEIQRINREDGQWTIGVEVGYWRKANQIHNWFVANVQNGEDECRPHTVTTDHLNRLLQDVTDVLKDKSTAADLLPTTSGFFFGGTEYDNWYFEDLQFTKELLTKLVEDATFLETHQIQYCSSW